MPGSLLAFVGATLVWGGLAVIAHELAHAATAVLVGRRVAGIDWWGLAVYYELPESGGDWRDRVVGVAPAVSGLTVALLAFALGWRVSIPQWLALGVYAFNGGLDDFRISSVTPEGHG